MSRPLIQVGQVWKSDTRYKVEYHIITSIREERRVWGQVRYAYSSLYRDGKIVLQENRFSEVDFDSKSTGGMLGWICVSRDGLEGLRKRLKRDAKKLKNPPVYRRTKRKEYRDRLIAEALTGKPIA